MRYVKGVAAILIIVLLTIVTQVGGIIFLISLFVNRFFVKRFESKWSKVAFKFASFFFLYLLAVFIIVPLIAKPLGRVPLPLLKTRNLQPGTVLTFFLSRNYVRPELREIVFKVAETAGKEYLGTTVNYLDANFPFINKFPLLPHLSHNDGKKIDFSFLYTIKETGEVTNQIPSIIGYGVCESPSQNEENMPALCDQRGYWQYNFLQKIIPQEKRRILSLIKSAQKNLSNSLQNKKKLLEFL